MSLMKGLAHLFGRAVQTRNHLYDARYIAVTELSVPVVSVGNISVGGTGKTSFVIWLLRALESKGIKAGVVSRGYGGQIKTVSHVPLTGDAKVFGDEPCMIARENLGPVYVGPKRSVVGQALLENHQVDLIIADDAFQHRRLHRDTDVVLLDFSEPPRNWELLPYGRLREGFSALERADVIVETKREFGDSKNFPALESKIPAGKIRLRMNYRFANMADVTGQVLEPSSDPFLLVSGVAQPEGVEMLARTKAVVKEHAVYDDHHGYTATDVSDLLQQMKACGAGLILTTEKDAVKLSRFSELNDYLRVMKLDYAVEGPVDEFFKVLLRKNR